MSNLIDRQAAIDALHMHLMYRMGTDSNKKRLDDWINGVPSAQPDTSRIENILHGKSPEEQYDILHWLMATYAMQYTDSREAVIAWLGGAEGR